jgi:hypothetical protein
MNQVVVMIKQELHVINKSEDAASKLRVPVGLSFADENCGSRRQHRLPKPEFGFGQIACPAQRRNTVLLIFAGP